MLLLVSDCITQLPFYYVDGKPGKYPVVIFFFSRYRSHWQYLCETVRVLKTVVQAWPEGYLKFIPEINIQIAIPGERFYIENLMERSSVIINFPLFSVQMCVEIRKSITFAQVNVHKTRKPWEICAYINKPGTIVHQKKKNQIPVTFITVFEPMAHWSKAA